MFISPIYQLKVAVSFDLYISLLKSVTKIVKISMNLGIPNPGLEIFNLNIINCISYCLLMWFKRECINSRKTRPGHELTYLDVNLCHLWTKTHIAPCFNHIALCLIYC